MMRLAALAISFLALCLPAVGWAQNHPPVANAGPDRNAYTGQTITLLGSATDPDGDAISTWTWEIDQVPIGGAWTLAPIDSRFPEFTGYLAGNYVVLLMVADEHGLGSVPDFVTIRIRDNLPPIAVATADRTTIRVGETVCFDGSQSSDPEGGPLRYIWDFADGSPYLFDVVAPCHVYESVGTFDTLMQVIDERNATDIDIVEITVTSAPPVPALSPSGFGLLGLLLSLAGAYGIARRARAN